MGVEVGDEPFDGGGGGEEGDYEADEGGDDAEGVDDVFAFFEELVACGGGEGDEAEEEAEFDGGGEGHADEYAADDGDEAAADARPEGEALHEADEEGLFGLEFGELMFGFGDGDSFFGECEYEYAAGEPGDGDGPVAEEYFFDVFFEEEAHGGGGDEGGDEVEGHEFAGFVLAEEAFDHVDEAGEEEDEDCEYGAELDADGVGVGGLFVVFVFVYAEEFCDDVEVAGGADGEVFGDAFYEAEDDGLVVCHAGGDCGWGLFGGFCGEGECGCFVYGDCGGGGGCWGGIFGGGVGVGGSGLSGCGGGCGRGVLGEGGGGCCEG